MLTVLLKSCTERILDEWWFGTKQTIQTNIFTLAGRSKLQDLGGALCFVVNDSLLYTFPSSKFASIKFSAIILLADLPGLMGQPRGVLLGILGGVCHPVLQTLPYFRPKYVILWGGTYLYGLYKGVPSRPLPGRATRLLLLHVTLFLEMKCGILYQEPITYIEYFLLETAAYI